MRERLKSTFKIGLTLIKHKIFLFYYLTFKEGITYVMFPYVNAFNVISFKMILKTTLLGPVFKLKI